MTCYYVYLHRKKTTGEVFYVGKGKNKRAWDRHGRSDLWKKTATKCGWDVEILQDNLQEWYAFELETGLIALYGRLDLGDGSLVNLSDGGEGPPAGKAIRIVTIISIRSIILTRTKQ